MFHKVYNNWKYEPDIFTYPVSPLQQSSFLPFKSTACCCALAGTVNCYYCSRSNRKVRTTTKLESDGIND